MFTDVVGFTSLAQNNEQKAMTILSRHNELIRRSISRYSGREVKTIGDAFLIEFPSALDAVKCSFAVQQEIHEQNMAVRPEDRIQVRVGIHVGDVIYRDGDILGDAVNISSRIEPLASPGGVCISAQVFDQIRNKIEFPIVRMETQKLKNVNVSIDLYKIVMPWETAQTKHEILDPRRVAVLPFRNMSPDPNDEYFVDGMTEELITSLSNVKELTVIARTSVMQYKNVSKKITEIGSELNVGTLIEGSVRKASNRVRITVQMIDAQNDGHIWAQNYDRQLDDIFGIQSEIAERVARELRVQLVDTVKQRIETVPTQDTEVHNLYLKGKFFWNERSKESIKKAIAYFEQAIKKDPTFALGYAGLANCYQVIAKNGLDEFEPNYQKVKQNATKSLELEPDLAEAHTALAAYLHYYEHDLKRSDSEYRRALELNPSYSTAHQWYSHLLGQQGLALESIHELEKAIELDPFSLAINDNLASTYYFTGEYDKAIAVYKKIAEMAPNFDFSRRGLIEVYNRKKMFDEAMHEAEAFDAFLKRPIETKLLKAQVLAAASRKEEARKLLSEVETVYERENIGAYAIARVYFTLGEVDTGFKWLQKAYDEHDGNIMLIGIDLELENVREDPRYLDLMKKIRLAR